MDKQEHQEQKSRIQLYDSFEERKERLIAEKEKIENGILKIIAAYQVEISFGLDHKLEDDILTAICNVYDKTINELESAMMAI